MNKNNNSIHIHIYIYGFFLLMYLADFIILHTSKYYDYIEYIYIYISDDFILFTFSMCVKNKEIVHTLNLTFYV